VNNDVEPNAGTMPELVEVGIPSRPRATPDPTWAMPDSTTDGATSQRRPRKVPVSSMFEAGFKVPVLWVKQTVATAFE